MASAATKQGATCPRRVSMNKTDMMIKMFLWAQQDKHGTPGRDEWTESTGLGIAVAGGLESAVIRRALSQRRAGGALSQRRAGGALSQRRSGGNHLREPRSAGWLSPRTAGWMWAAGLGAAEGGVIYRDPRAGRSRGQRRTSPAIGGLEGSRPADSRRSRQTPTPPWRGLRAGWRAATSLPRDRQTQEQNKNFSKNEQNKTRWRGAAYCLGLVFCHGAHTREDTGTRRRGLKLK